MRCKILMTEFVTHDTKRFILEKPETIEYKPGQACEISIDKDGWRNEKRPFTFTSLNNDEVVEFIIKRYDEHDAVTKELHELEPGEYLLLSEAFGAITYKGKGVFIAGGAGVTPFIAILRDLNKKDEVKGNKLIFSNKTSKDIILEKEFREMLGDDLILTLTDEVNKNYYNQRINKEFIKEHVNDFSRKFYVCGPPKFVKDITQFLKELGADTQNVVIEK